MGPLSSKIPFQGLHCKFPHKNGTFHITHPFQVTASVAFQTFILLNEHPKFTSIILPYKMAFLVTVASVVMAMPRGKGRETPTRVRRRRRRSGCGEGGDVELEEEEEEVNGGGGRNLIFSIFFNMIRVF